MKDTFNKFSVPLGLLDYINPIFYTITIITIMNNIKLESPYNIILLIGSILSIIFGFIIPTCKVLVGLKIIEFKMPVLIVFMVNLGIFISGLMVLKYVFKINLLILTIISILTICFLILLYLKSKKMNTIAVLIGAVGYILLYISLITLSINNNTIISIIFYGIAIVLFIMLCGIGIKANLKNPKIHWIIEISNVICQMSVAIATLIVFK